MARSWHTQSELVTFLAQHRRRIATTDRVVRDVPVHGLARTLDHWNPG